MAPWSLAYNKFMLYKNAKEKLFYKTKSINIFNIDDIVAEEFFNKSLNRHIKS